MIQTAAQTTQTAQTTQATAQATGTQAAPQSTIPSHLITRVEFGDFWDYFLVQDGSSRVISRAVLLKAKDALLKAGVPPWTAFAYFLSLAGEAEDAGFGVISERIMNDLQDLANGKEPKEQEEPEEPEEQEAATV